jgi:two-component system response regulator AtoC
VQRVLLVGRNDDERRAFHVMLAGAGKNVAAVDGAEDAARYLEANACDAVFVVGADHLDELAIALRDGDAIPKRVPVAEASTKTPGGTLIGDGAAMRELRAMIGRVAQSKSTVLINGESGTGKELVAKAIHDASSRRDQKFVAINCAAIPATLLESELFGHVRGAFTDAVRDKPGLFEEADGGTLLLDEVGEMPLPLQAKLLRVLQESEVRRVGGDAPISVDVRVIAATLRDLDAAVKAEMFREDLFYRLNVVPMHLAPLRERPEDVPQLARFFLARHAQRHGRGAPELTDDAIAALSAHEWAGNVRELENVLERALVLADGAIDAGFLGTVMKLRAVAPTSDSDELSIKKGTRALEARLIERALAVTQGNRTNAAKLLEISHRALLYKMKEYGIS